jgi:sporulation protein YlmC with PRC-barrel domain
VIRLSQLVGQRVLSRRDGGFIGSIRKMLLDPSRGAISRAALEAPIGGTLMLEWSAVVEVGSDAVMIASDGALGRPAGERDELLLGGRLDLIGKTVLTDEGDSLGELEDVDLDELSGRVVRLHLPGQVVTPGRFVALGPDALIIAATSAISTAASTR